MAHLAVNSDTHTSTPPESPTPAELVEWAKDQAFRQGIAGWHSKFNVSLFEGSLAAPSAHERRKTVKTSLEESEIWWNTGDKQAAYLERNEGARNIVNTELDKMLLSAGVPREKIVALQNDYLEKVVALDKKEHPRKLPHPQYFKAKVFREAPFVGSDATCRPIDSVDRLIEMKEAWLGVHSILCSATWRYDRDGKLVQGHSKGHWVYRFETKLGGYSARNELSDPSTIEAEADYHRMVDKMRVDQQILHVVIYQQSIETRVEDHFRKVQSVESEKEAMIEDVKWQEVGDDGQVVTRNSSFHELLSRMKATEEQDLMVASSASLQDNGTLQ